MQRRLHRRQAEIHHLANLLQRAAEHVHQNHAGALRDRQPHEGAQACTRDLAARDGVGRVGNHVRFLARSKSFLPSAAAEKVQRGVVRDAKQPALGIAEPARRRKLLDRLDQRVLQHVFAIDHRADHARAIAMQLRPHRNQQGVDAGRGG